MLDEVYTVEECEEVSSVLLNSIDSLKYVLNCPKDNPDNKKVTADLLEGYANIAALCTDFINAYEYYSKAKLWESADANVRFKKATEFAYSQKKSV